MSPFTMKQLLTLVAILFYTTGFAQLLPPINGNTLPKDDTKVCYIPMYSGGFDASGFKANAYVNDFTLFDNKGNPFNLKEELKKGKPVLIMGGNITCPVFRDKINDFNALCLKYKGQITPIIVYGIEAHPDVDTSIYFGKVNTGSRNVADNILFRQPTTYKARKNLVDTLLTKYTFECPIFIDQPCNEWWSTFGPAPNNAYLIDTMGKVFAKHGWFNKHPNNMACDIDSLLGLPSSCAGTGGSNGTFQLKSFNGEDTARDVAGSTLYAKCTLKNNSSKDVVIQIVRKQVNVPQDWQTSMCIIQCLGIDDDSTTVVLKPNQTEVFSMDFFTSKVAGKGNARVEFKNLGNTTNSFNKWFYAETSGTSAVEANPWNSIKVYPNPSKGTLFIDKADGEHLTYKLFNMNGLSFKQGAIQAPTEQIDVADLSKGLYILEVGNERGTRFYKIQIEH